MKLFLQSRTLGSARKVVHLVNFWVEHYFSPPPPRHAFLPSEMAIFIISSFSKSWQIFKQYANCYSWYRPAEVEFYCCGIHCRPSRLSDCTVLNTHRYVPVSHDIEQKNEQHVSYNESSMSPFLDLPIRVEHTSRIIYRPPMVSIAFHTLRCWFQVAPKIKAHLMDKGNALVGYQPLGDIPNFFRMILSNPASSESDADQLLDEIAQFGESE